MSALSYLAIAGIVSFSVRPPVKIDALHVAYLWLAPALAFSIRLHKKNSKFKRSFKNVLYKSFASFALDLNQNLDCDSVTLTLLQLMVNVLLLYELKLEETFEVICQ